MPCLVHASSSLSVLMLRNLVEFQSGLMQWQCHLGCFEPSIFSPNSCTVFGRDSREIHLRIREKLTKISRPFLEGRSISGALHDRTTQEPNLDRVSPILARPKKSKPIPWPVTLFFFSHAHLMAHPMPCLLCFISGSFGCLKMGYDFTLNWWRKGFLDDSPMDQWMDWDTVEEALFWLQNHWLWNNPILVIFDVYIIQDRGVNDFKVIGEERDLDTKTGGYRTTKSICGVCPIPIYNPADTSGMSKKSKWQWITYKSMAGMFKYLPNFACLWGSMTHPTTQPISSQPTFRSMSIRMATNRPMKYNHSPWSLHQICSWHLHFFLGEFLLKSPRKLMIH